MHSTRRLAALVLCASASLSLAQAPAEASAASPQARISEYITASWDTLSRSMFECKSVVDPKVKTAPILYLPAAFDVPPAVAAMHQSCGVEVRHLPRAIHALGDVRPQQLPVEGLLYLPNRYVVPGGRFNEMYGWDSYFILLGLVHDHRTDLARGMVENFFFEIENYGAILNANRTYFFTRSQPPFLSSMIREIYEHPAPGNQPDLKWLARAYSFAQRDYALWISPPHQAGSTGLARYHDLGQGPVPEMADDSSYYPDVIRWLLAHPEQEKGQSPPYLVASTATPTPAQQAELVRDFCDIASSRVCAQAIVDGHRLSSAYFRSDRAMRESGFDTSFRFGPFSGSTENFAPVCLNSLLYKYELDMEHLATLLGRSTEASEWKERAEARKEAINRYLWDSTTGLYVDYNFVTGHASKYYFIATFYPLWAGAASSQQAASVQQHLALFEQPGGLKTSDFASGVQWDAPFGWAPTNWLAISGLDQFGFHADAVRLAQKFSATIVDNFLRDGTIREKYDVASGSANVQVAAGYKSNVVGFGWTNAVYRKMQDLIAEPAAKP